MIIRVIVGFIKKISLYEIIYFPELDTYSKNNTINKLNLSNYEIKSDLKSATGFDTSKFAKKADLTNLKSDVEHYILIN